MKAIACALAAPLLLLSIPVTASAQAVAAEATEHRQQLAREIIERGFPEETRMDVFGGVMQQVVAQLNASQPQLGQDPEVQDVIQRFQQRAIGLGMQTLSGHMSDMMDGLAVSYAETFTLDELQAFHAFVMSPQGHGFLAKSSMVSAHPAFAAANQAYINEFMAQLPQLQQEFREELEAVLLAEADEPTQS